MQQRVCKRTTYRTPNAVYGVEAQYVHAVKRKYEFIMFTIGMILHHEVF